MPFGFEGIVQGAAILFTSYFGVHGMVTAGNMVIVCPIRGVGAGWAALGQGFVEGKILTLGKIEGIGEGGCRG